MNFLERVPSQSFPALAEDTAYVIDAFRRFDINGDGVISEDEFERILSILNPEEWTHDKIHTLMDNLDCNQDGLIQYQEFILWCCSEEPTSPQRKFDDLLHSLSATWYDGILLHFDAGAIPEPQMDEEHGVRLEGQLPAPADGFAGWEFSGRRPVFAWELGLEDLRMGRSVCSTRQTKVQQLEPPFVIPGTSFSIGLCLRRWPGEGAITLLQCSCGLSVALHSDGRLLCSASDGTSENNRIHLPSHQWIILLLSVSEGRCTVFGAWDVHGWCRLGEFNDSLGGKTLCSIGRAESVKFGNEPGACQIAKLVVWSRALAEVERSCFFTACASRFGIVTIAEAKQMNAGRPAFRTVLQEQEYLRRLECVSAGGEPHGIANFSGLRVTDDDLPEIIKAVSEGRIRQLRLVDLLISPEGLRILLDALHTELEGAASVLVTGCKAVAEIGNEIPEQFPDFQISHLETESCGFESFDVCRFQSLIKSKPKLAPEPKTDAEVVVAEPKPDAAEAKPEAETRPAAAAKPAAAPKPDARPAPAAEAKPEAETRPVATGTRLRSLCLSPEFKKVEKKARDTPEVNAKSPELLARYCKEVAGTDAEKAWFVFAWCGYHIDYDCGAYDGKSERLPGDAESVLKQFQKSGKRLGMCDAYSQTFHAVAEQAGLNAQLLHGHARNASRSVNQDIIADGVGAHGWNAVEIEGTWYLFDPTWSAGPCTDEGFQREFTYYWFGVPPEEMAFTHFPADASWQLLAEPISYQTFIRQPIVMSGTFFGQCCAFEPYRPSGTIVLDTSNQGSLQLCVPRMVGLNPKIGPGIASEKNPVNTDEQGCWMVRDKDKATVHFRVPSGDRFHSLLLYMPQEDDPTSLTLVARFLVKGPARPAKFIEPFFPRVNQEALLANNIQFEELLPPGVLTCKDNNQVRARIRIGRKTQLIANCNSADSSILVQYEDERVTILAQRPEGEDELKVFASPNDDNGSFPFAVGWKIAVLAGCKIKDPFPTTLSVWAEFRGFLEMPMSGKLKRGKQHFRMRFDKVALGAHPLFVMSAGKETELRSKDGVVEGDAEVSPPAANVVYEKDGFLVTIMKYQVS